jgi:hypothetical protein
MPTGALSIHHIVSDYGPCALTQSHHITYLTSLITKIVMNLLATPHVTIMCDRDVTLWPVTTTWPHLPLCMSQPNSCMARPGVWTLSARKWVHPDFMVKVDDDSFVMLAELEEHLCIVLHVNCTEQPCDKYRDTNCLSVISSPSGLNWVTPSLSEVQWLLSGALLHYYRGSSYILGLSGHICKMSICLKSCLFCLKHFIKQIKWFSSEKSGVKLFKRWF